MRFDDLFTDSQAQSAAGGFRGKIGFEYPVADLLRNTAAVVADLDNRLVALARQGNVDMAAPVGRNSLYSIDNQVIKHPDQVIFIPQNMIALIRQGKREVYIFLFAEQVVHTFHHFVDHHIVFHLDVEVGKHGKLRSDLRQRVDLFDQARDGLSEVGGGLFRIVGHPLQLLHGKFHGCQRVLDVVGYLAGHFTPGAFPFEAHQLHFGGFQFVYHPVVLSDEFADFILCIPVVLQ